MPEGVGYPQPQGLDAVMQALATGGQPVGQTGKEPSPLGVGQVSQGLTPQQVPGLQDPAAAAVPQAPIDPIQIQAILQALMGGQPPIQAPAPAGPQLPIPPLPQGAI